MKGEKLIAAAGVGLLVMLIVSLIAPAAVFAGALAGWTTQWLWPQTTADLLAYLGIHLPLWKIGAGLGFVGFFVKPSINRKGE